MPIDWPCPPESTFFDSCQPLDWVNFGIFRTKSRAKRCFPGGTKGELVAQNVEFQEKRVPENCCRTARRLCEHLFVWLCSSLEIAEVFRIETVTLSLRASRTEQCLVLHRCEMNPPSRCFHNRVTGSFCKSSLSGDHPPEIRSQTNTREFQNAVADSTESATALTGQKR